MRRTTFRQLQIFDAVARNRSFTRASEELFLTQSTVSTQMKELAENIGAQLVEVVGKKIYVTPVGERLQQLFEKIKGEWDNFELELAELNQLKKGHLNLTAINTAQYFMPRVLGQFAQLHPKLKVSLKVTNRQDVINRIQHNVDDLYILGSIPEDLELKAIPLADNPLVVVANPDHPLKDQKNIPINQFEKEAFISREAGSGTRKLVDSFFQEHKLSITPKIELGGNEAIKQGIMGGFGISILSAYTICAEIQTGQLIKLDFDNFPINKTWYISYLAAKKPSPAARSFLDYTKDVGRDLMSIDEVFKQTFKK